MPRRNFKREMAYLMQQGKKTATTRYSPWKEQEQSNVYCGSMDTLGSEAIAKLKEEE